MLTSHLLLCVMALMPLTSLHAQQGGREAARRFYDRGMQAKSLDHRIELFRKAREIDPTFPDALYQLGRTYFQKGDYAHAAATLSDFIDQDSVDTRTARLYLRNALTLLAFRLRHAGDPDAALVKAQDAVQLDKDYAPAWAALGFVYADLQVWPQAGEALEKSLALQPQQDSVWSKLGDVFLHTEEYSRAVDAYQHALALTPDLASAKANLKIARKRNAPEAWLTRAQEIRAAEGLAAGTGFLEKALASHPGNPVLSDTLAAWQRENTYVQARAAIGAEDWPHALELLQTLDPTYRDVAQRLEQVQGHLATRTQDARTDSAPPAAAKVARHDGAVERQEAPLLVSSRPVVEPAVPPRVPANRPDVVSPEPSPASPDTTRSDAGGSDVASQEGSAQTASDTVSIDNASTPGWPTAKRAAGHHSTLTWIATVLGGLVFLGLAYVVVRKKSMTLRARRRLEAARARRARPRSALSRTEELFHARIASDTPVEFDPQNASERLSHTDDSLAESTNGGSRPDQETRTILGGIRQVKHIGRYVVEKEIGRGSMGLVYKAWDPKLDRTVVIKQVTFAGRGGTYEIDRLKERLHREAMAAAQLNHPNIVIVYDVGEAAAFSYIVMEYVEGEDLKALLARSRKFPLARTVAIVSQICEALEFAHRHGVVHRDIKPSNILVTRGDRIKIADFGIAKMPKFDTLTLTGNVVGTPFYMSPEQVEGRRLDGRTDIFSTGVVLYEMLTGIRPFAGESIPTVVYKIVHKIPKLPSLEDGDLPPHFDRIVEKALAKDPEERYATAGEMLEELTRVQQEFG